MFAKAVPFALPVALVAVLIAAPALAQDAYKAPGYIAPPATPAPPAPPVPPRSHSVLIVDGKVMRADDMTPEQRAKLEAKMQALSVKMADLNIRLKTQAAARDAHLKEVMARVDVRVREANARAAAVRAEWTPERIHALTERAQARADHAQLSEVRIREITRYAEAEARAGERAAEAGARAAEAAARTVERIDRQLEHTPWTGADPAK